MLILYIRGHQDGIFANKLDISPRDDYIITAAKKSKESRSSEYDNSLNLRGTGINFNIICKAYSATIASVNDFLVSELNNSAKHIHAPFQYIHIYDKTDNIITLLFLIEYSHVSYNLCFFLFSIENSVTCGKIILYGGIRMDLLKKLPQQKNSIAYNVIIYILSFASIIPIFMPVILGFLSDYTRLDLESGNTKTYIIFRSLFGLTYILALFAATIFKNYVFAAVPVLFGTYMSVTKLIFNINQYKVHHKFAMAMNQPVENNAVLKNDSLYILMYSLFLLLCVSLLLYLTGVPHTTIFVLLFSVTSAICSAFIVYTEAVTCEIFTANSMASGIEKFHVISFVFSIPSSLIPTFIILNSTPASNTKYKPKRMKK